MLHFKLFICIISEFTQSQTFISSLSINFFIQFIFFIVQGLQYILFSIFLSLALLIKLTLKVLKIVSCFIDKFITFSNSILNFFIDSIIKVIKTFVGQFKLFSVIKSHSIDFSFHFISEFF